MQLVVVQIDVDRLRGLSGQEGERSRSGAIVAVRCCRAVHRGVVDGRRRRTGHAQRHDEAQHAVGLGRGDIANPERRRVVLHDRHRHRIAGCPVVVGAFCRVGQTHRCIRQEVVILRCRHRDAARCLPVDGCEGHRRWRCRHVRASRDRHCDGHLSRRFAGEADRVAGLGAFHHGQRRRLNEHRALVIVQHRSRSARGSSDPVAGTCHQRRRYLTVRFVPGVVFGRRNQARRLAARDERDGPGCRARCQEAANPGQPHPDSGGGCRDARDGDLERRRCAFHHRCRQGADGDGG